MWLILTSVELHFTRCYPYFSPNELFQEKIWRNNLINLTLIVEQIETYIIFSIYPEVDRSEPTAGRIEITGNIILQARQMPP